jgi:hypothetical protein
VPEQLLGLEKEDNRCHGFKIFQANIQKLVRYVGSLQEDLGLYISDSG